MSQRRDIYMAIMHAAANGRGLHINPDEAWSLALDDAIATRAANVLNETEHVDMVYNSTDFWRSKKPYRVGEASNLSGYSKDDAPLRLTAHNVWHAMVAIAPTKGGE